MKKLIIFLCGILFLGCERINYKNNIYVKKLVYDVSDSILFTGLLDLSDSITTLKIHFKNGVPTGKFQEIYNNSEIISQGEYLDLNDVLTKKSINYLNGDTLLIKCWSEGVLSGNYEHLSVFFLKNTTIIEDTVSNKVEIKKIKNLIYNDTKNLKYKYLTICFVDKLFDWEFSYCEDFNVGRGGRVSD